MKRIKACPVCLVDYKCKECKEPAEQLGSLSFACKEIICLKCFKKKSKNIKNEVPKLEVSNRSSRYGLDEEMPYKGQDFTQDETERIIKRQFQAMPRWRDKMIKKHREGKAQTQALLNKQTKRYQQKQANAQKVVENFNKKYQGFTSFDFGRIAQIYAKSRK